MVKEESSGTCSSVIGSKLPSESNTLFEIEVGSGSGSGSVSDGGSTFVWLFHFYTESNNCWYVVPPIVVLVGDENDSDADSSINLP